MINEYKKSFFGGEESYLNKLRLFATNDKHLLDDLYNLTILFNMLDWSCDFNITEKEKECLLRLVDMIIVRGEFCLPNYGDGYGNVNIPQSVYDFTKLTSAEVKGQGELGLVASVLEWNDLGEVKNEKAIEHDSHAQL